MSFRFRGSGTRQLRLGLLPGMLLVFLATEDQARAYADPGSGALLWQIIVSGIIGSLFYFRRLKNWFRKEKDKKD